MNPEIKAQWVAALRSGKYKQGKGLLRDVNDKYCCLGVLCDLAVKAGVTSWEPVEGGRLRELQVDDHSVVLPSRVRVWADLSDSDPWVSDDDDFTETLSMFNDAYDYSFAQIADLIEEQL